MPREAGSGRPRGSDPARARRSRGGDASKDVGRKGSEGRYSGTRPRPGGERSGDGRPDRPSRGSARVAPRNPTARSRGPQPSGSRTRGASTGRPTRDRSATRGSQTTGAPTGRPTRDRSAVSRALRSGAQQASRGDRANSTGTPRPYAGPRRPDSRRSVLGRRDGLRTAAGRSEGALAGSRRPDEPRTAARRSDDGRESGLRRPGVARSSAAGQDRARAASRRPDRARSSAARQDGVRVGPRRSEGASSAARRDDTRTAPRRPDGARTGRPPARTTRSVSSPGQANTFPRTWGSLARKGARAMSLPDDELAEPATRQTSRPKPHPEEIWLLDDDEHEQPAVRSASKTRTRSSASGAARPSGTARPSGPTRRSGTTDEVPLPRDVVEELSAAVGRRKAGDLGDRMARAARAYERDRYPEALRLTRAVVDMVPESPAARELHGLVCYRLGRWREATSHLGAARTLSGDDPSQLPVIMDCHRAQGHHRKVEELWEELRSSSPPADVLAEGRLVLAAHRADRGELDSAIGLLAAAGAARNLKHPAERHLRQWYVLADLFERAGDLARAREMFARVAAADPELADAQERLAELGRSRRRSR